jgi:DNA-binding transcriptional regulator YiaG
MHIIKEQVKTRTAEYVSESQAANILGKSTGTVRNWRYNGKHAQFLPHLRDEDGNVLYNIEDVMLFKSLKMIKRVFHVYPRTPALFSDAPIPALDPEKQLSTAEAALTFGIPKASLNIWRSKRQFSDILPSHGSIFRMYYLAGDLAAFIQNGRTYWKARSIERNHQYRPRSLRAA